jgi:carboxyl-terminal processing protease
MWSRDRSDPEKNFEALWQTFQNRYPFFDVRQVDWAKQYDVYRPQVTTETDEDTLFEIFSRMLTPLNDGHVELWADMDATGKKRYFHYETQPVFYQNFSSSEIKELWRTTEKTLSANGFSKPVKTGAWMLYYRRSSKVGYLRILELEGVRGRDLTAALDLVSKDFADLKGFIIDIRDCPGGDDSTAIAIINRFCDRERVAFRRQTKIGPNEDDYSPLETWHLDPGPEPGFTGPIVLLTCDSVFSGGEVFALAMRELPHVTIVGDHTNGIFSYQLEKRLPNGWDYRLSYQKYFSADLVCYEGSGVPADIELRNTKADLAAGVDPLIERALQIVGQPI